MIKKLVFLSRNTFIKRISLKYMSSKNFINYKYILKNALDTRNINDINFIVNNSNIYNTQICQYCNYNINKNNAKLKNITEKNKINIRAITTNIATFSLSSILAFISFPLASIDIFWFNGSSNIFEISTALVTISIYNLVRLIQRNTCVYYNEYRKIKIINDNILLKKIINTTTIKKKSVNK